MNENDATQKQMYNKSDGLQGVPIMENMIDRRTFLSLTAGGSLASLMIGHPLMNLAMAATESPDIKAIAFDGFPLFDPRSIMGEVKEVIPENGGAFGKAWFDKIFAYTWLRTSAEQYKGFHGTVADALDYTAEDLKITLRTDQRDRLLNIWLQLKLWPDVMQALKVFKNNGIRLGFLSNLSEEMLRTNTRSNGIENAFEFYLSTDVVQAFKPDPRAYQMGVDAFQLPKRNIAFAAFGAWDAAGASWFGYPTVWVNRFGRPVEKLDSGPIVTGRNIETLVDFVVRKKG
jgi:2-haloacid dehalogenase